MSDLEDMNHDSEGIAIIRFSRADILLETIDSPSELSTESHAKRELELLKLRALAHSFKLDDDPNMWLLLAFKLAQLRYPEPKKAGRKLKWTKDIRRLLKTQVEKMAGPRGTTNGVNKAIKQLANIEPWLTLLGGKRNNSEALRIQYYKAIK